MKQVGIIMGSKSDLPVMQDAIDILKDFEIDCEVKIVSAHRTPDKMFEYAKNCVNSPNYPKASVGFFLDLINLFVRLVGVNRK